MVTHPAYHDWQLREVATRHMGTAEQNSAMRRKVQAGRADHQARAMSIPKALRLTLAKVANELFDLPLAALGITSEKCDNDACPNLFDDARLLILLDGPGPDKGAVMIDTALVGALVQQQTMGQVLPEPPGEGRLPTSTDAALCAPLLDMLLERAATLPDTVEERQVLTGFRFGARAVDTRLLTLALEAPEYHVFRLTLDIARGVRQGEMLLCLPVPQTETMGLDAGENDADETPPQPPRLLCNAVMDLHADLNVAITRISMPLSRISNFAVGDMLALGHVAFDKAVVQTTGGRTISKGVLGQVDGQRAVRLLHTSIRDETPRRRATDRAALALPEVEANGLGLDLPDPPFPARAGHFKTPAASDMSDVEAGSPMSDLEGLPDAGELPDLAGLSDLRALPDMSDLPGFEDDEGEDAPRLSQRG